MITISYSLLLRILDAFVDMQRQGAECNDKNLMEDLDRELDKADRRLTI